MKFVASIRAEAGVSGARLAERGLKACCDKNDIGFSAETHGPDGVENELDPTDIAESDAAIISGKGEPYRPERFEGKPQVRVMTDEVISDPVSTVRQALRAVKEGR